MAIELDKLSWAIREPDPAEVERLAAIERQKQEEAQRAELDKAKRVDEIRLKVNSGADLSSEEEAFLKTLENGDGKQLPAADAGKKDGSGEIAALIEKMEKGEALTDDELKRATEIAESPAFVDKEYKIGGKAFKSTELFSMWVKDMNLDPKLFPEEAIPKIVETYATKLNKDEWSRAQQARDQNLAKTRRQTGEVAMRLLQAQDEVKSQLIEAQSLLSEYRDVAAKQVDVNAMYDENGRLDPVKNREFSKILDARETLPKLEKKIQSLQERSVQTERQLVVQRFRDFQDNHPEYQTSQDIAALAAKMGTGELTPDDETKIGEMVEIFQGADSKRWTPEQQYGYRASINTLSIKPTARQEAQTGDPSKFTKGSEREALLANLKKKREAASALPPGATASPLSKALTEKEKHAWNLRASTQSAVSGAKTSGQKLQEAGY